MFNPKVFVAEFIGTFALVFIGAASGLYNVGLLGVALAHGLTFAVFAYVYGYVSGAHLNPAISLALALNGTIQWLELIVYWVAQFAGAALAAFFLRQVVGLLDANAFAGAATHGLLTTDHPYYALGLEALLTFFLVNTVLHTAVGGKAGQFAGWAIGTTYTIAVLAGGPLTGASMNPARTLGPAIFTSAITASKVDYQNPTLYLIYFVGPFFGAIMAVLLYQMFKSEPEVIEVEEEEEVVIVEEPLEEEMDVEVEEPVKKAKPRKPAARKSTKG